MYMYILITQFWYMYFSSCIFQKLTTNSTVVIEVWPTDAEVAEAHGVRVATHVIR